VIHALAGHGCDGGHCEYQPALDWLRSLGDEEIGLPGFVVMELMDGCRNKLEMNKFQKRIEPFRIYWPTDSDCNREFSFCRALADFARGHLSHDLGIIDALIGECAVGIKASLCTFNVKHFKAIAHLTAEQPYEKSHKSSPSIAPPIEPKGSQ
jgi:predicted nucleic acid-binding protein